MGDDFLPIGPKVKKTVSFFVGRVALFHPPIRYQREVSFHSASETSFVLFGGYDGRLALAWTSQERRFLNPRLKSLVPGIRSDVICAIDISIFLCTAVKSVLTNDTDNKLAVLVICSHDEGVVHNIELGKEFTVVPEGTS